MDFHALYDLNLIFSALNWFRENPFTVLLYRAGFCALLRMTNKGLLWANHREFFSENYFVKNEKIKRFLLQKGIKNVDRNKLNCVFKEKSLGDGQEKI